MPVKEEGSQELARRSLKERGKEGRLRGNILERINSLVKCPLSGEPPISQDWTCLRISTELGHWLGASQGDAGLRVEADRFQREPAKTLGQFSLLIVRVL